MRNENTAIINEVGGTATSPIRWWRTLGILCLILAATAVMSPGQDQNPSTDSVTFTTLLSFDGANGGNPGGILVQGRNGNFYGTTIQGGANTSDTFFKVSPAGTLTTLYNFCSQTNCADGMFPADGLVLGIDGNFYGITVFGGSAGSGTAFKITPTGTLTTLHNWCSEQNPPDGCYGFLPEPARPFVQAADGNFYGVNDAGGPNFSGVFFKLTPAGTVTTLYTFCSQPNCTDGASPTGLIEASDGNFYGTTYFGGTNAAGTAFKITRSGTLTTLYNFCSQGGASVCTDGASPFAGLIQAADGDIYGSTTFGGANVNSASCMAEGGSCGTIFKITPQGTLTTVYNFCSQTNCTDGASPEFTLAQATDGNLYGSTVEGGNSTCTNDLTGYPGCGTVFKLTPGGVLTTLHSFDSTDGSDPEGTFQGTDGVFYGTTENGATSSSDCLSGCGTIFSLAVGLGPFVETLPTSGKAGETIKILGTNLTGASGVSFNGVAAMFKVISKTLISATVPVGATTGFVTVTTPSGTLKSNLRFRVIQ